MEEEQFDPNSPKAKQEESEVADGIAEGKEDEQEGEEDEEEDDDEEEEAEEEEEEDEDGDQEEPDSSSPLQFTSSAPVRRILTCRCR